MSSWYSGGFAKGREISERQQQSRGKGTFEFTNVDRTRFFVRVAELRHIVFLDNFDWKINHEGNTIPVVPFGRYEHKLELDGDWKNPIYVTCARGSAPCKLCELGFKKNYIGAMTILDITPYKNKTTGEMMTRPFKKLLMATPQALCIIDSKKERKGNLLGMHYSVTRHKDTHPRTGSDYEYEGTFDFNSALVQGFDLAPYNLSAEKAVEFYKNLFKPMTYEEQERLLGNGNVTDGLVFRKDKRFGGARQGQGAQATGAAVGSQPQNSEGNDDDDGQPIDYEA